MQHRFLKSRSTLTDIKQLKDFWLQNMEKGKHCSALLLDLQAGFNVINVKLLCEKLKTYGFDDNSLSWFKDYLTGRSQCVQIDSKLSASLEVPWGVPQGSQISQILFTIFIMELPDVIEESHKETAIGDEDPEDMEELERTSETETDAMIVIYADDNTPSCARDNLEDLEEKTEELANTCADWFHMNDMILSSDKTKLLIIGTNRNR